MTAWTEGGKGDDSAQKSQVFWPGEQRTACGRRAAVGPSFAAFLPDAPWPPGSRRLATRWACTAAHLQTAGPAEGSRPAPQAAPSRAGVCGPGVSGSVCGQRPACLCSVFAPASLGKLFLRPHCWSLVAGLFSPRTTPEAHPGASPPQGWSLTSAPHSDFSLFFAEVRLALGWGQSCWGLGSCLHDLSEASAVSSLGISGPPDMSPPAGLLTPSSQGQHSALSIGRDLRPGIRGCHGTAATTFWPPCSDVGGRQESPPQPGHPTASPGAPPRRCFAPPSRGIPNEPAAGWEPSRSHAASPPLPRETESPAVTAQLGPHVHLPVFLRNRDSHSTSFNIFLIVCKTHIT